MIKNQYKSLYIKLISINIKQHNNMEDINQIDNLLPPRVNAVMIEKMMDMCFM